MLQKFYMEKIPKCLKNFLTSLDSYLEHETTKCDSFFYFKNNKMCESFDNPLLDDMKNVKNPRNQLYFFYRWEKYFQYFCAIAK